VHVLAQESEKLFRAAAAIALLVPNHGKFADRLRIGEPEIDKRFSLVGHVGKLR
jgi:hypothetical protein